MLEEKLVAEKYLRASGLDYTIVRPGGLKAEVAASRRPNPRATAPRILVRRGARASLSTTARVSPSLACVQPPTGALFVSGENTLNSGEISRDLVADVSVAALFDAKASNQVVEIVESDKDGNAKTGIFNGLKM